MSVAEAEVQLLQAVSGIEDSHVLLNIDWESSYKFA